MKFGCHVSIEGGVSNAVKQAARMQINAFAMWTRNGRGWVSKPLDPEEIARFKDACSTYKFNPRTDIVPHASYLINLANPNEEMRLKSYNAFIDELNRCELLDIGLYNLHPGSTLGTVKQDGIKYLADAINRAHKQTKFVKVLLENMAGNPDRVVGTELEDLQQVINLVEDKSRVGVCLDSCHAFAAGNDFRSVELFKKFWEKFDKLIGREYLGAMHLNDSCWPYESHRDQHAAIGEGFIGLEFFRILMNSDEFAEVPMILETGNYDDDLATLNEVRGKQQAEVKELENSLFEAGKGMRTKNQAKTDAKSSKTKTKTKAKDLKRANDGDLTSLFSKKPKKAVKKESEKPESKPNEPESKPETKLESKLETKTEELETKPEENEEPKASK